MREETKRDGDVEKGKKETGIHSKTQRGLQD